MARQKLLQDHYSGFTMDDLAFALGMSKKTLYVHFPSKQALAAAIIAATGATIRRQASELIAADIEFPEKLGRVFGLIASHFGALGPGFLQDLHRHAPALHAEIDALKERNIPLVVGKLLALGAEQGMVRRDVDTKFLTEYWLQVIKGMHDPALLERTGLSPRESFEKSLDLFFSGLLTEDGARRWRARREKIAGG